MQTVKLSVSATEQLVPDDVTLTVAEALALPMVGAPSEVVYQRNLVAQIRAGGYDEPRFVIRLGHSEAMVRAAMEHDWAIIAPSHAVDRGSELEPIDVPDFTLDERIVLVHRRDKHPLRCNWATLEAVRQGLDDATAATPPGGDEDYQE